jgi:hypothetical protein
MQAGYSMTFCSPEIIDKAGMELSTQSEYSALIDEGSMA